MICMGDLSRLHLISYTFVNAATSQICETLNKNPKKWVFVNKSYRDGFYESVNTHFFYDKTTKKSKFVLKKAPL